MGDISITIILAQVANFLILFLIFKKFIADPMNQIIVDRRALLAKLDSAEADYAAILEKAQSEQADILMQARKDAEKLMRDMEEVSKLKRDEILKKAEKRAKGILNSGKRDLEKEKILMIGEMKDKILDLTLKLNEKILDKAGAKNKAFIKKELDMLVARSA